MIKLEDVKIKQEVYFPSSSDMLTLFVSLPLSLSLCLSRDHKYKLSRRIAYFCFLKFSHLLMYVFSL